MTLRSRNKMKKYFDDDDMGSDGEVEEGEEGVIRKINIFQED
jgi:hypothetical protein